MREQAEKLGIKVDGRWSDERIQQEIASKTNPDMDWANTRVQAIWDGQSPSLSVIERTGRIRSALKERGFTDFEKLDWPLKECRKYL